MRPLFIIFTFFTYISSFGQTPNQKSTQLPLFLSTANIYEIENSFDSVSNLKFELKKYTLSIDGLENIRRGGNLNINTKNINKNFAFLELPSINLTKELENVMLKIPGKTVLAGPRGFTL